MSLQCRRVMRIQLSLWCVFQIGCRGGKLGPQFVCLRSNELLPERLQLQCAGCQETYVAPKYVRLAMGGSHSVRIGRTLFHYANRLSSRTAADTGVEDSALSLTEQNHDAADVSCSDEQRVCRQRVRRSGQVGASGYTVDGWCDHVRALKGMSTRTLVVMRFFAGDRREGDIEEWLGELGKQQSFAFECILVDLAHDPLWDLTVPATFHTC